MLRFRRLGAGLLAVAALAVSACQDDSTPTSPDAGQPSARVQPKQGPELPSAAEFARQVPGFGGFFLNAGLLSPVIVLTGFQLCFDLVEMADLRARRGGITGTCSAERAGEIRDRPSRRKFAFTHRQLGRVIPLAAIERPHCESRRSLD